MKTFHKKFSAADVHFAAQNASDVQRQSVAQFCSEAADVIGLRADAESANSATMTKTAANRPERFRIVLVEPEYELNIGATARAMKNFGFSDLAVVNPKCNPRGFDAIKYSKHARELLDSAKTCQSLQAATKGCKISIGTTGVLYRHWDSTFRTPITLKQLVSKLADKTDGRIALVFGNEGIGLSEKHISECDLLVTIPASKAYPILNLSHAAAIVLYELSSLNAAYYEPAGEKEKEHLVAAFSGLVGHYANVLRNPKKVKVAFRRMVGRSMLSDKECATILGVVRRTLGELEKKGGKKAERTLSGNEKKENKGGKK